MARNPNSRTFLRNRDVEDLLYLIHRDLQGIVASVGGGSSSVGVLVVRGNSSYGDGTIFVPDEGEADFASAKEFFLAGGTVLLSYENALGDTFYSAVASYQVFGDEGEELCFRRYGINVDAKWMRDYDG